MRMDLHDGFHLTPIRDGDQNAYVEHFGDKDTTDLLLKVPHPHTHEHADGWVRFCLTNTQKQALETTFALRRPDGFLIGGIGIVLNSGGRTHQAEIGYWIAKDYRGQGLATAMIKALCAYAFQHFDLKRIEATPFASNPASHRVLEKAGFTREGLHPGYHLKNGILLDACIYALIKPRTQNESPF